MSEARTVKVTEVEVKTGESNNKSWTKYTLVDGNGDKAGTFDSKVGKFLQDHIGEQVDITTEQSGKFTNLLSAVEHVEAPKSNGNGYVRDPETEMRIAREACIKAAVSLHGSVASGEPLEKATKEVIKTADTFVRWVYSGTTPELEALFARPSSAPTPIAADSPRHQLISAAVRAFNADPAEAVAFVAERGYPSSVANMNDDQLRDVIRNLGGVPA